PHDRHPFPTRRSSDLGQLPQPGINSMNLNTPTVVRERGAAVLNRQRPQDSKSASDGSPPARKSRRLVTTVLLVAIATGLGLGFWGLSRQLAPELTNLPMSTSESYSPLMQQKSIAVLPFADLNDNT